MKSERQFRLYLLFLVSCCGLLLAQVGGGTLVGTVTDASGATVAGAPVVVENVDTGIRSTARTTSDGTYRFESLIPGTYRIMVEQTGFRRSEVQNIKVDANRTGTVNVALQVGEVATTVEVREAGATIDTTTANVTTTFNSRAAEQLPITANGGLGVLNLSLLSAGVSSSGGVGYGTGPSVGGQRPTNNNFMIEGIDNNDRSVTGPVVAISNEAVGEFSLQQNVFSPEFGHSTGGQFNTIIKSGTNQFRGSFYEYFQNRNLNAVDQSFARQGILENPRYDYNRFGGTVGGPILRNRWFFFTNLEYNPIGQAATTAGLVTVPTAAGIQQLQGLAGVNQSNLNAFKQFVPAPTEQYQGQTANVLGQQIPLGALTLNAPSFNNNWAGLVSSDFNISERDQLRARYAYNRGSFIDTNANIAEFFVPFAVTSHLANLSWLHSFSPTFTNELRLGYNREVDDRPVGDYQWPNTDMFPNFNFLDLGLTIGPNGSYPQSSRYNTYQLVNSSSIVAGNHTVKFGYDGRKVNATSFFVQRLRGEYEYNTFERFLQDLTPDFAQRSAGGFPFIGNLLSHYLWVNDEWRLRPNLTLSLGLRYEYVGVPAGAKSQSLNALASVPGLLEFNEPEATKGDFAPRIGIAWSPGTSGKTSIRAGFGMAYDQIYQNLGTNSLPPQYFTTIDAHIERPNQPGFLAGGGIRSEPRPITTPEEARELTSSYIPNQVRPYSLQWNASVQRVFFNDVTVEVRYLGSRGIHLPIQVQLNRPARISSPEQGLPLFYSQPSQAQLNSLTSNLTEIQNRPLGDPLVNAGFSSTITSFAPRGNSTYHGLATQVTKRFTRGLQFTGAYTWSHLIDDSTASLFSTVTTPRRPMDFNNLRQERANSALDHRHRFSLGWLTVAPWLQNSDNWWLKNLIGNWTFSGTYIIQTGTWATFRSGVDSNLNGDSAGDRVVLNPNGDRNIGSGTTALTNAAGQTVGYLVTNPNAAWIAAPQGVFPTAGRNLVRFPMINNVDASLGKRFSFGEGRFFEIRGEFYNALNNPQYTPGFPNIINPPQTLTSTAIANVLIPSNPNFQRWDLAFPSNARIGQLVARIEW